MEYVLTPDEMKAADSSAINEFQIPSIILMENAARAAADHIIKIFEDVPSDFRVSIFCGSGNNGGDGFALARQLYDFFEVEVFWTGNHDKMSEETSVNFIAIEKMGISITHLENEEQIENLTLNTTCIIDALIGVGGSENLRGKVITLLKKLNEHDAIKIAIDIPTGLNAETGATHEDVFRADFTITMYALKSGMMLNDGYDVSGEIFVAYLGAPVSIVEDISKTIIYEEEDVPLYLPERSRISSKFDYGRVAIVAGSEMMPGAAALMANACIKSGPGHVYLFTPRLHASVLPEIIPYNVPATDDGTVSLHAYDSIMKRMESCSTLAVGPGFGDNEETIGLVRKLIDELPEDKTIVIDADGLKAIDRNQKYRKNIILTPHVGEFSHITGISREDIYPQAHKLANEWAEKLNCTILLKHFPVIVTNGEISFWIINGNPGMATAGSGDVLTGIIAGLSTQIENPLACASTAAFIHARAGELALEESSEQALTASLIMENIKKAF